MTLPLDLRRAAARREALARLAGLPWWRRAAVRFLWWWRRAICPHGIQTPCGPACRLCMVCGAVLLNSEWEEP